MKDLKPLVLQLADKLLSRGYKLAVAESCTGGLLSSFLTQLPGSSLWFDRGFVTYSNSSKEDLLGVEKLLIEKYGAVSEKVAKAMAIGTLKHSQANLTVAITGIAGPDGGSIEKPVGTVWLAFASKERVLSKRCEFGEIGRERIRFLSCEEAIIGVLGML